mgnify:CR=1 FL=1
MGGEVAAPHGRDPEDQAGGHARREHEPEGVEQVGRARLLLEEQRHPEGGAGDEQTRDGEDAAGPVENFDEIWHLAKPRHGAGGWVLAGIQQVFRTRHPVVIYPASGTGAWIPRVLVHRKEVNGRVDVKDTLRTVPVMNIPVDDRDPLDLFVIILGISGGDRDVIENAKPHRVLAGRDRGGQADPATEHRADDTDDRRDDETTWITTGHDPFSSDTGNESENDPAEPTHDEPPNMMTRRH